MRREINEDGWAVPLVVLACVLVLGALVAFAAYDNTPSVAAQANHDCVGHRGVGRIVELDGETTAICRDGHAGSVDQ